MHPMPGTKPTFAASEIEVDGRRPRATVVVYRLNDVGGAEQSTVLFLERLSRSEFATRVLVLTGACDFASRPELEARGMVFVEIHAGWPGRIRTVARDLLASKPDLVHTTLFGADLVGRLLAPLAGAPVMVSVVNQQYSPEAMAVAPSPRKLNVLRFMEVFLARFLTTGFHALTAATGAYAVERLHADPKRVVVVPRGRHLERYQVEPAVAEQTRRDLGLAPSVPMLVNVARHEPQKGQELLLEAFASTLERHPDAVLCIAGREGTQTPVLERTIAELGLGSSVQLLGVREDIPALLAAATIFVSSARYEGFGGAVLEAMASGAAVAAFDIGPVREVLDGTGVLVPLGDTKALGMAMAELIDDPGRRTAMGAAARESANQRFSAEATTTQLTELYRSVVVDHDRFARPMITRAIARLTRR